MKEETVRILNSEEETKRTREQSKLYDTENEELKKALAKRTARRKDLEKSIAESEAMDLQRIKLMEGEIKNIDGKIDHSKF